MKTLIAALSMTLPSLAVAQEAAELKADLIHADVPIFDDSTPDKWPQHFTDEDGFGCSSRVAFGTWAFRRSASSNADDTSWYRFSNYGAFHCWANVANAERRADLASASSRPSFFVLLEKTRDKELWALQLGARPGSDYLLLARKPAAATVRTFDVLQRDCPSAARRGNVRLEILLTQYCSINSRVELLALAHRMAKRPPLGSLTFEAADDKGT